MTTTFSITRDEREIPLEVIYSVSGSYIPAIRDVSPEEWPEMADVCAYDATGKAHTLTPDELDRLYEQEKRLAKEYDL